MKLAMSVKEKLAASTVLESGMTIVNYATRIEI
jgi:hypothetical protein